MENQAKPKPKVSVCIPVYNGEQFLADCIASVLEQDFDDFELVVVDNCSVDSTEQLVASYTDTRVQYIKNATNIGSIGNFNKCIEVAQGEYFVLLPHDDMLLPGALRLFSQSLSDPKVGFAYSAIQTIDADGNKLTTRMGLANHDVSDVRQAVEGVVDHFVPIQLAMVRTKILQHLDGFDPKYGMYCDIQMWLSVVFDNWNVAYHDVTLSCHRVHENQGQQAFRKSDLKELSKHWGKELDRTFWVENNPNHQLMNLIDYICNEMARLNINADYTRMELLKIFIRSHISSIVLSILQGQLFVLHQDLLLFGRVHKFGGLGKILVYYPYVILVRLGNKFRTTFSGMTKMTWA